MPCATVVNGAVAKEDLFASFTVLGVLAARFVVTVSEKTASFLVIVDVVVVVWLSAVAVTSFSSVAMTTCLFVKLF